MGVRNGRERRVAVNIEVNCIAAVVALNLH